MPLQVLSPFSFSLKNLTNFVRFIFEVTFTVINSLREGWCWLRDNRVFLSVVDYHFPSSFLYTVLLMRFFFFTSFPGQPWIILIFFWEIMMKRRRKVVKYKTFLVLTNFFSPLSWFSLLYLFCIYGKREKEVECKKRAINWSHCVSKMQAIR